MIAVPKRLSDLLMPDEIYPYLCRHFTDVSLGGVSHSWALRRSEATDPGVVQLITAPPGRRIDTDLLGR